MKFHTYVLEFRKRHFKDSSKFCKVMGVEKAMWRKVEKGINPPPRRSILKKFSNICHMMGYETQQMYALARRWEPSPNTNTYNHLLIDKNSSAEWKAAIIEENTPDYDHKYWGK
tara:strand:+ start:149 stop:490 length:342 start_codon:yes stop_codon:yes gene_type:complete